MPKKIISAEQFSKLPELHRIVVEQKVRNGEWAITNSDFSNETEAES